MEYNVIVSERAKRLLDEHMGFIAERNEDAAWRIMQEILQAARSSAKMPHRHPFLNHPCIPLNKYRKTVATKHYLLLYQIRNNTVLVDYVIDCRQDYVWLLQ